MKSLIKKRNLHVGLILLLSFSFSFTSITSVEAKSNKAKTEKITTKQEKRLKKETKAALNEYGIKDDTSKKLKDWTIKKDTTWKVSVKSKKHKKITSEFKWNGKKQDEPELISLTTNKKEVLKKENKKTKEVTKKQDSISKEIKKSYKHLASLDYSGEQTIDVNKGVPYFTDKDLSIKNGAWETYGDLDSLNRATVANALLNQSLMPTEKRGDISKVKPTGWKNKEIKGGYLYNRSHLIGFALSGENDNWKNLITGTRQLNSPEMLRHEMDVKEYLERDKDNYVRYRITPIFKDDELLARGVHLMAQSVNDDTIRFNVYIFNIQDNVELNYADGSSVTQEEIAAKEAEEAEKERIATEKAEADRVAEENRLAEEARIAEENRLAEEAANQQAVVQTVYIAPDSGTKYHFDQSCRGLSQANSISSMTLSDAQAQRYDLCGWED